MKAGKKPLDPVVKAGLGVLFGAFCLIGFGMFLSRPDRTIPPYSIGAQEGTVVAVHLPPWTSDPEIESLIRRFGLVGRTTKDFGPLKIRPTTPDNPKGGYQQLFLLIFSDHTWAEPDNLHRYLDGRTHQIADPFLAEFEQAIRGGYRMGQHGQAGWLGGFTGLEGEEASYTVQWVFQEP
ncbi:MAG: hypothetical protein KC563_01650 [Nitrospira sp.]|nr:hypothetical protein [Nitrospira sp.]MCA9474506.1 hypothetical protein [Nitrospira sp.]MCA9480611.1 hypothetical protein [Nitrospira sp.]MCB9711495.1 hypothetical protein [Nitrospiraceae bacterium]MDR4488646.1 hypothetical protein [Nitrospirales bacterium]